MLAKKVFRVAGSTPGTHLDADHLGSFTFYIRNVAFRFVVTRLSLAEPVVTHRVSGRQVARIPQAMLDAARGDYVVAGKAALERLVTVRGADHVYSVLNSAERDSALEEA